MVQMQEKSDIQLLREYAEGGKEAAFHELVMRHTDFVYSAAARQVNSPDLACDVAQSVFTDLARKARPLAEKLPIDGSLSGWLHRSTRFAALNHLRDSRRRHENERQAMEQLLANSESTPDWERIRPVLDEALDTLGDEDREALLLRYFKNHDFRAVGVALGVSDDAAQKRVSRAIERLQEFFSKRGITVGTSGLIVIVSANAMQAAPVGLAVTISGAVLSGTVTATAVAANKAIAMTTAQKILIGATLTIVAAIGIFEARQAAILRGDARRLQEQQVPAARLASERNDALSGLQALQAENERLKNDLKDLPKLRAEITRLRRESKVAATPANNEATTPIVQPAEVVASTNWGGHQVLKWGDTLVLGGLELVSGKTIQLLTRVKRGDNDLRIALQTEIVDFPGGNLAPNSHMIGILEPAEHDHMVKMLIDSGKKPTVMPSVTTPDGHVEVALQSGSVFPGKLDPVVVFDPTISTDGQTVDLQFRIQYSPE